MRAIALYLFVDMKKCISDNEIRTIIYQATIAKTRRALHGRA